LTMAKTAGNWGVKPGDKARIGPFYGTCRVVLHLRAVIEVDGVPVKRSLVSGEVCGFNDLERLLDDFEEYIINNTGVLDDD
jgi:hypothetical protein